MLSVGPPALRAMSGTRAVGVGRVASRRSSPALALASLSRNGASHCCSQVGGGGVPVCEWALEPCAASADPQVSCLPTVSHLMIIELGGGDGKIDRVGCASRLLRDRDR